VNSLPHGDSAIPFTLPLCASQLCSSRAAEPSPATAQQCTLPSALPAHSRPGTTANSTQLTRLLLLLLLKLPEWCPSPSEAAAAES
jgi:hypothetical protein